MKRLLAVSLGAALLASCSVTAFAKGGGGGGGRGGSVSSSRSFSAPSRSYVSTPVRRSTPVTRPTPATTPSYYRSNKRDDDVECSTLRNSRYPADRQVYRRYC